MAPYATPNRAGPVLDAAEPVPLAVWACAQAPGHAQRAGRYLPESTAHPGKMLPELARRITAEYAPPGGLVVDPMCGIGTTLVEAATSGRRSVGVELEPRWADLAPPYACTPGMIDKPAWQRGGTLARRDTENYSTDRANLGHARGAAYLAEMATVYAGCFQVLRPGGLLVTVTRNLRRQGRVFDLAAATVTLAQQAGYQYLQHVVVLLAAVRGGGLHPRPSFWQLTHTRRARGRGEPASLLVHEDVQVFAKPTGSAPAPPGQPRLRPQAAAPQESG